MRVVILGAGGHGQVVADLLWQSHRAGGSARPVGFLDDDPRLAQPPGLSLPMLGPLARLPEIEHDAIVVAIGDNQVRQRVFAHWQARGERFAVVRHPSAVVAADAQIGPGSQICAGVVVGVGTVVEANAILNTSCSVDHHNRIGAHVHIGPGAHLGGEVIVEAGALVGIGATVLPRCRIGAAAVVGAAACVTGPVPAGTTVVGVPARPRLRSHHD